MHPSSLYCDSEIYSGFPEEKEDRNYEKDSYVIYIVISEKIYIYESAENYAPYIMGVVGKFQIKYSPRLTDVASNRSVHKSAV